MFGLIIEKINKICYLIRKDSYLGVELLWKKTETIGGVNVYFMVLLNKLLEKCVGELGMLKLFNTLLYYLNFLSFIKAVLFSVKVDVGSKKGTSKVIFLGMLVFFFKILFWFVFEFVFVIIYILYFINYYLHVIVKFYKIFSVCKRCDLYTPKIENYYFNKYIKEVGYKRVKK